jgi:hypothetical protein
MVNAKEYIQQKYHGGFVVVVLSGSVVLFYGKRLQNDNLNNMPIVDLNIFEIY